MDENSYGIKKIGPQRYREDPGRYFEDFQVGDVYEHWPGRTVSEADNIWFTNLTMNTHPIHFDANYASKSEFGKYLVNSAFTLALVTGMCVSGTSQKAIANLGWEEIKIPAPVFVGDTLYSETEVLDKRELRIIRLYFGLDGTEALTLEEIGGMMGLTRERVRQLKERALGKLRHPSRYQALLSLVDSNEVY